MYGLFNLVNPDDGYFDGPKAGWHGFYYEEAGCIGSTYQVPNRVNEAN